MLAFSNRSADATVTLSMDMTALIPTGATISSSSVTAAVFAGSVVVDPTPSAILDGASQLSGNILLQRVTAGVVGCTYVLTFAATFSDGSNDLEQALQTVAEYVPS